FRTLRRDIPLVPPEPVSVAREMRPDQSELPSTMMVDQAIQHAARVQSEPSYRAPEWVDTLLNNKELVEIIARRDNRKTIDGRLEIPRLPRAA
ncbi:MAG: hypothetical protein NTX13_20695, partial [Acidobacteria bacterium]|nr:hypothetical protein [Acidobacteriota bacterium]